MAESSAASQSNPSLPSGLPGRSTRGARSLLAVDSATRAPLVLLEAFKLSSAVAIEASFHIEDTRHGQREIGFRRGSPATYGQCVGNTPQGVVGTHIRCCTKKEVRVKQAS